MHRVAEVHQIRHRETARPYSIAVIISRQAFSSNYFVWLSKICSSWFSFRFLPFFLSLSFLYSPPPSLFVFSPSWISLITSIWLLTDLGHPAVGSQNSPHSTSSLALSCTSNDWKHRKQMTRSVQGTTTPDMHSRRHSGKWILRHTAIPKIPQHLKVFTLIFRRRRQFAKSKPNEADSSVERIDSIGFAQQQFNIAGTVTIAPAAISKRQ